VKIAVVVQRYGADISGGAELHARYVAERLARHVTVEVLTTCARDYITWRNELAEGADTIGSIVIRRFPVVRERDPEEFGRQSKIVFEQKHSVRDELAWLEAEGPASPALIQYTAQSVADYDFFLFFSARYYHAWHGARAVPGKAILVPTAERDGALGLLIFRPLFRGVRALMYNSFEERALIQAVSQNHHVPNVVVGIGSEIPERTSPGRFRQKFDFRERFAIYVGRIDQNKGCAELFDFFQRYARELAEGLHLVLIGTPIIPIPQHPRVHHLGFVSDQDKFDAMAAAELLIMPSYFESLSMVALEAWALGKPVLANARCDVLKGQSIRSNGGLYYDGFEEFLETLRTLDTNRTLASALGRNGQAYFQRHYTWPVIEAKYLEMFERLSREPHSAGMEPLPGWLGRRRKDVPPADEVVRALPSGHALERDEPRRGPDARAPVEPRPVLRTLTRPSVASDVRAGRPQPLPNRDRERPPERRRPASRIGSAPQSSSTAPTKHQGQRRPRDRRHRRPNGRGRR
jgi:glycosyltransferase involved in cell wall biosynthesis